MTIIAMADSGDADASLTVFVVVEEVMCPGRGICMTQILPKEAAAKEKKDLE